MGDQLELYPSGLTRSQFDQLSEFANRASGLDSAQLLDDARQHLEQTVVAHATNRMINLRLATAIVEVIEQVVGDWHSLPDNSRSWLAGAMHYFAKSNDDEPDFGSPIGFEDDTEVLNACLKFARLDDLCLNVEDYDDA